MRDIKIAVLGAGSFVFGPSLLHDLLLDHKLANLHIALMDVAPDAVELMAGVGRRMAQDAGIQTQITAHTDRREALGDADYVVCSAARQLYQRFETDCQIVDRYAPGHLITEFGGITGISYSLRQIALIQEICADMRDVCPRAVLLDVANPLPRVAQGAHEEGVRTIGFCSASLSGYSTVWQILHGGEPLLYPFEPAFSALDVTMGGVNHQTWLTQLRDRQTGRDLMPELREKVRAGATAGQKMSTRMFLETGCLLMAGDNHIKDFFLPTGEISGRSAPGHGTADERKRRMELLRAVGSREAHCDVLLTDRSWERLADLIAAETVGTPAHFTSLNLLNDKGQIPHLPPHVFVETAANADKAGLRPERFDPPASILSYLKQTAAVTDAIVRAARWRDPALVHDAVDLDPTITDKSAGHLAIDACMQAHADLVQFSDSGSASPNRR